MGKRRTEHPVENNPFIDAFQDWMDSSEGQLSIHAHDLVFDALDNADVDARGRKIIWSDGKRLSIEQSVERIHADSEVPRDLIETHVVGWLESCAPEHYSESQIEELDRLTEQWLEDYERRSKGTRK